MANSEPQEWTISGVDLFLELARGRGLRAGVEDGLRQAIRAGRLARGTRLPPTRALARDLGVSRGTVVQAYAQLAAEGWVAARQGSATVVAVDAEPSSGTGREPPPTRWRFDLRPGRPDPSSFPRAEWLRALRRALATASGEAFDYGSPQGQLALRSELAGYLSRARGLHVAPGSLLITTGFTQASASSRAVSPRPGSRGRGVAIEQPSMPLHRSIVRAAGHELVLLDVDGEGAGIAELEQAPGVGAVVLTPNRQHPTGVTLSASRRARLLAWARATGAIVIEDDYDGEFRYDSRPIGPLQSLDPRVVAYAGTASKTLAPGVRIGWLALPQPLRKHVIQQQELADWGTSALEQLAFTELLRGGAYDRHIRKMRLRYRRRRDTLTHALDASSPRLNVLGTSAGLNLLIPLPDAQTERRAIAAATAAGLGFDGLATGGYYESHPAPGLIIGYAAAPEHGFQRAAETLLSTLESIAV